MEPELDNGSVVELVYLAAHGDEAVAVLNLLDVFLPGRLRGDLTQHRLGGRAVRKNPTEEGSEKCEVVGEEGGGGAGSDGGRWETEAKRWEGHGRGTERREQSMRERVGMTAFGQIKWQRSRKRQAQANVIIPTCDVVMCV